MRRCRLSFVCAKCMVLCSFRASNGCSLPLKLSTRSFVFKHFLASFPLFYVFWRAAAFCSRPGRIGFPEVSACAGVRLRHNVHKKTTIIGYQIPRELSSPKRGTGRLVNPEFRSCEVLWEETPHPARYSRHPLPKGEGGNQSTLAALSLGERVSRSRRSHQPGRDG